MGLALRSFDFYDLMDQADLRPSQYAPAADTIFFQVCNVDASESAPFPDGVYSNLIARESLSIMSAFRKDLFVSVTLPILGLGALVFAAVGGSYAYTLGAFNRLDDSAKAIQTAVSDQGKIIAVSSEQISRLSKSSDDASTKLDKVVDELSKLNTTMLVMKAQKTGNESAN